MQVKRIADLAKVATETIYPPLDKVKEPQVYTDGTAESDESIDARLAAFNLTVNWDAYVPFCDQF